MEPPYRTPETGPGAAGADCASSRTGGRRRGAAAACLAYSLALRSVGATITGTDGGDLFSGVDGGGVPAGSGGAAGGGARGSGGGLGFPSSVVVTRAAAAAAASSSSSWRKMASAVRSRTRIPPRCFVKENN